MISKFQLGDMVFFMHKNRVIASKIYKIKQTKYKAYIWPNDTDEHELVDKIDTEYEVMADKIQFLNETYVFSSKDELIKSL